MKNTNIEWCDHTWNPITGCLHHCEYCYARAIANRFGILHKIKDISRFYRDITCIYEEDEEKLVYSINEPFKKNEKTSPYPFNFKPTFHRYKLNEYANKKASKIFVGSMSDIFGDWVPEEWIKEILSACDKAPQHQYMFLTKNPKRYKEFMGDISNKSNYWLGTSVTNNQDMRIRGKILSETKLLNHSISQHKTFLSIEPLLEKIDCSNYYNRFDWVIIGAETGNRKNLVVPKKEWVVDIVEYCMKNNIPVFMKNNIKDVWQEELIQTFPNEL